MNDREMPADTNDVETVVGNGTLQWFVMRDLTRPNVKMPAYRLLEKEGIECFTPLVSKLVIRHGRQENEQVPFIHDLLFVHSSCEILDPLVERIPTFQYRYLRKTYRTPMTVRDRDMDTFIRAVRLADTPQYYRPEEITPEMYNRKIRIMGGLLEGHEGYLLSTRGSKSRRLLVELPGLLAASVEVEPEYIQLL